MIGTLGSFVAELRSLGLPVSTAEALDAAAALQHVDLGREIAVREALAATMIKVPRHRRAFDVAFDVFFGLAAPTTEADTGEVFPTAENGATAGDVGDLRAALANALLSGDRDALRLAIQAAVRQLSGFQTGRPVGGRYYLYRVLQRLEGIEGLLADDIGEGLEARLGRDDVVGMMDRLEAELRREIIRRLVADRGPEAVARTLREPLVEDIDLMHATLRELASIEAAVAPLANKLAARLAQRRRQSSKGRLDLRRTIRRSLSHGGALIEPQFKRPRPAKPEIVLLCDVSGSMATFARFTMQLTYAVASQFSSVRSFAFIDAVDEVTGYFGPSVGFASGLDRMSEHARVVGHDGHSDYGCVLRSFVEQYSSAVTPRTTLIVAGDARSNYRDPAIEVFAGLAHRARTVLWLNPEARRFWSTGDSVMSGYSAHCDAVHEVRTLRQLEEFVANVALQPQRARAQSLN